jgi:hypothetical protein
LPPPPLPPQPSGGGALSGVTQGAGQQLVPQLSADWHEQ